MNKQQLQIDPATSYAIVPWMSPVDPRANLATHGDWKSPVMGQNYPTRFKIQIPSLDASFEVTCTPREQEIVSKLSGVNKYEGAADVTGTCRGEPVTRG